MLIKIYKRKSNAIYDVFVDGQWAISRGAADNIMAWLAEKTKNSPAVIEFEDEEN